MKVFVTGGTGFIGGHVVRRLRERGDEVSALVRDPLRSQELRGLGCEPIGGTLTDTAAIRAGIDGCDAAIHGAAVYEVGIPQSRHRAMYEANVVGTENVLRAALDAGLERIVYISTVGAFGNTHGQVVDESYRHSGRDFTSYYEQTKYEAHEIARRLIAEGLRCVIVQPGGVYGPGDHSAIGKQMSDFLAGRMPLIPFPDLGMNLVHVEDVAAGVLRALDKGRPGESYVLGGEISTMRGMINALAAAAGRRPPRGSVPTAVMKVLVPAGPIVGKLMGQPPNLRELISSADGVTFWATDAKARAELGYSPRDLAHGLPDIVAEHERRRAETT